MNFLQDQMDKDFRRAGEFRRENVDELTAMIEKYIHLVKELHRVKLNPEQESIFIGAVTDFIFVLCGYKTLLMLGKA